MRIGVWAANTIGGSEKAAVAWAAGLRKRGYQVDFLGPRGPRSPELDKAGVPVLGIVSDESQLRKYLTAVKPDIVHQHVPGYPTVNPLYKIWAELGPKAPQLIETNIFGRLENPLADKFVRFRLFISLSSAVQAFRRARKRLDAASLYDSTVVCYSLPPGNPGLDMSARTAFRQALGVAQDEVLALRIGQRAVPGQPGNKWTRWECEAFTRAKTRAPSLRMLIMEPPRDIWQDIDRGLYGPGIIIRENTSDFDWLQKLYASADCMIHASNYGESFGYTVAEAMSAGLPLIVRTTPWGDNAQVELVKNRETGFVCASVAEMGRRLVDIALGSEVRQRLGRAGREHISRKANLSTELDVLEGVLNCVAGGRSGPALEARARELLTFAGEFPKLEWSISESALTHPIDYARARLYSLYRSGRFRLGALRKRWLHR